MQAALMKSAMVANDGPLAEFFLTGKPPQLKSRNDEKRFYLEMGKYGLVDEFFFARVILGYSWLEPYHREWLTVKNQHRTANKLRLRSRGTGKSTVHTIVDTLWEAANDITKRQLIVNAVEDKAISFLRAIRNHVKLNPRFMKCYPHMRLLTDAKTQIEFYGANEKMGELRPEPSVAAIGTRGALVSSHWDIIRGDDIVGPEDAVSDECRKRTIFWFQQSYGLRQKNGWYDITGTPWHLYDLYRHIEDSNDDRPDDERFLIDKQGALADDGSLNFPSRYSLERLDGLKKDMGSELFNSQIICRPLPEESQLFRIKDASTFDVDKWNYNFYNGFICYIDPATGKQRKSKRVDLDYTAVIVGGFHIDGFLGIMRAIKIRCATTTLCSLLCDLQQEFKFTAHRPMIIEANGFQFALAEHLEDLAIQRGLAIPIQQVVNTDAKKSRIAVTEPAWVKGQIRLREDWREFEDPFTGTKTYRDFINEMVDWPMAKHDDCPDAYAGLWRAAAAYMQLESSPEFYETQDYEDLNDIVDGFYVRN